jgi:DNA polymerase III delta subunit
MSVFAFTGDDDLQRQEALERQAAQWSEEGERSGDGAGVREVYHGEELSAHEVAESYQTQDIFAARKLIVIRNFDKVRAEGRDALLAAFKTENPNAAVLLEAGGRQAGGAGSRDRKRRRAAFALSVRRGAAGPRGLNLSVDPSSTWW